MLLPVLLVLTAAPARAASLDNLEVGGFSGSPLATDGTASWWNPAGLAAGSGLRLTLEGAPTFAQVDLDRTGARAGHDSYRTSGVVPFVGVASDLGVHGLGVGASLAVPYIRGGAEEGYAADAADFGAAGSGSYALRSGTIEVFQGTVGAAWNIRDRAAVGLSAAVLHSRWSAVIDNDAMPDLDAAITAQGESSGYTSDDLENPDYKATLAFDGLTDTVFTVGGGVRIQPLRDLTLAVAFQKGVRLDNEGSVDIAFQCPPQSDTIGRFGAEQFGICDTVIPADAAVAYSLPARVHGGIGWQVTPDLHVEADAGWVGWSVFSDFAIDIADPQAENTDTVELLTQQRLWARANLDSFWFGAAGQGTLADRVTLGAKLIYDQAAVPDEALSANNYDADTLKASGMLAYRPVAGVTIGVSYTHDFVSTRVIDDSRFGMTLPKPDLTDPNVDRWYYPSANGTYASRLNRIGVSVQIALGKPEANSAAHAAPVDAEPSPEVEPAESPAQPRLPADDPPPIDDPPPETPEPPQG